MELEIRELQKRDHKKAIQAAVTGMHFDWYTDSPLRLSLFGRYFWYLELNRATQVIAAYQGNRFAGVLLADLRGEPKRYRSFWRSLYVNAFDRFQDLFVRGGSNVYEETNRELFARYCQTGSPDGEIVFLAAAPDFMGQGVGTFLLGELERRTPGKQLYLYTDDACSYQFYEHRGFSCSGKKTARLKIGPKQVDLQCFLYYKQVGSV